MSPEASFRLPGMQSRKLAEEAPGLTLYEPKMTYLLLQH
jgi:hypothetical protein